MKKESKQLMLINIGFFFLFVLDRILKWWALNSLSDISPIKFFRIFRLELYLNEGIIFSVAMPKILIYLITVSIIVIVASFLASAYRKRNLYLILGSSLILIGAFSNLLDRMNHGAIIDFVNLRFLPVFNLADCLIVSGAIIMIFKIFNSSEYHNEKIH